MSKYIWKIISGLLIAVGCFTSAYSQKENTQPEEKTFYGLSVDVDLMDPILHLFDNDRFGLNAGLQADLFHTIYPTFVVGYGQYDASDEYSYSVEAENNSFKVNGVYFKIGAMFNVWRKDYSKSLNSIGYIGINYAIAPGYKYEINNYPIGNFYWEGAENPMQTFNAEGNTTAQWGEFVAGVKTPIVGNFCLGVEVMYKLFLHINADERDNNITIHPSYAPGFGDKEDGKWGFRYTISYFFHL